MATRAIVTSHPVVACDVCGRSLLRGENPDVFLAGGQRRTVCELCVPRASAEGWLREADNHASRSARPARAAPARCSDGCASCASRPGRRCDARPRQPPRWARYGRELPEDGLYDSSRAVDRALRSYEQELYIGSVRERSPSEGEWSTGEDPVARRRRPAGSRDARGSPSRAGESAERELRPAYRALAIDERRAEGCTSDRGFQRRRAPRRVAGVARSLGAPAVTVRALEDSGSTVAIVVAWELCWYRYEVDLGDEAAGPSSSPRAWSWRSCPRRTGSPTRPRTSAASSLRCSPEPCQ